MWKLVNLIPIFFYILLPFFYAEPVYAADPCHNSGITVLVGKDKDPNGGPGPISIQSTDPFELYFIYPKNLISSATTIESQVFEPLPGIAHLILRGKQFSGKDLNPLPRSQGGDSYDNDHWLLHWNSKTDMTQALLAPIPPGTALYAELRINDSGFQCDGPVQIHIINVLASIQDGCSITMPDNYKDGGTNTTLGTSDFGPPIRGTVQLKKVDGVSYFSRVYRGNITAQLPKDAANPSIVNKSVSLVGFTPPFIGFIGSAALGGEIKNDNLNATDPNGSAINLPTYSYQDIGLNPSPYTATVWAETQEIIGPGVQVSDFACGFHVFTVTSSDSTVNPQPGSGTGTPGSGGGGCTGTGCSSAGGTQCNPDTGGQGSGGILTAIGCIPTQPKDLITKLIGFSAGIGGGIALLLMILGAFQMMTSAGNPEAIKKGRDQFVAAALGLLFVIFSALLLKIIGVDILNIPGFS